MNPDGRIIRNIPCPMCGHPLPIELTQGVTGQVYASTAEPHRCPVAGTRPRLVAA